MSDSVLPKSLSSFDTVGVIIPFLYIRNPRPREVYQLGLDFRLPGFSQSLSLITSHSF